MVEALIVGLLAIGVAIFLVQPHYKDLFSMGQYAAIGIVLTAIFFVASCSMPKRRYLVLLATLAMLLIVIVMSRRPPLNDLLSGTIPSVLMIFALFVIVAVGLAGATRDWGSHYRGFLRTFAGETLVLQGADLNTSGTVSLRGRFIDRQTVQVEAIHVHAPLLRDASSYLGLALVFLAWVRPLWPPGGMILRG